MVLMKISITSGQQNLSVMVSPTSVHLICQYEVIPSTDPGAKPSADPGARPSTDLGARPSTDPGLLTGVAVFVIVIVLVMAVACIVVLFIWWR